MILIADIQAATAAHYHLPLSVMRADTRRQEHAIPRMVAMYLSGELTSHSLCVIGALFDRDHSTVIHARREIERRLGKIGPTRKAVEVIERQLGLVEMTDEERLLDATDGSVRLRDAILEAAA